MSFEPERMQELTGKAADAVETCSSRVRPSLTLPEHVLDEIRKQVAMAFIAGRESAFNQVNDALHGKSKTMVTQLTTAEQAARRPFVPRPSEDRWTVPRAG